MGKTKKAGLLARAVACLAATIAIALGTASPAFAAIGEPNVDPIVPDEEISVTVPTSIPCTMMADGTVVAPSDLSIVNSGDAVVVDAYTADAMGNAVDFTLDVAGKRVLDRRDGHEESDWTDISELSRARLDLHVSELSRQSNAALMDAASAGRTDMFKLGFKFNLKELRESVAIAGDPSVGSTLTANVVGAQEDAQLSYQWYRVERSFWEEVVSYPYGETIPMMQKKSWELDCGDNATLYVERTDGNAIRNGFFLTVTDIEGKQIYDGHVGGPDDPAEISLPCAGKYKLEVLNGDPYDHKVTATLRSDRTLPIDNATSKSYIPIMEDEGKDILCKVTDASGKYKGTLTSDPFGPIANLPKTAFAVYSADDQSLDFYKRTKVPAVGDTFEGKTVTNVYTGIEDGKITPSVNLLAPEIPNNSPFTEADRIASVSFVDRISAPSVINSWFSGFSVCTSGDFKKLDTCNVRNMFGLFSSSGFTDLDLSSWDTSNVDVFGQAFSRCRNLKSLNIDSWTCKSTADSYLAFLNCPSLRQVTVGGSIGQLIHELPTHDSGGRWYNKSGIGFISEDIPTDVADTYTYRSTPPKFTGSVTFSPQAEVAEDRQTTTINISYTYSPRDAVVGIVKYEVADDANGLNAREVAIDKNVLQEPVWGKYMRITIADTSGKYEGSVDSGWIGRMATEFYGRGEITDVPQQGTRPGYRVTGPILVDGQSDLSCYDIRWEIAEDANGLNARPHDELNAGRYLKTEDIGKYVRIVVSAKAPYSVHVPGSIASGWVEVRGHSGGDIMRTDSSMVEQDDAVGKVLISSKGGASDE